MIAIALGFCGWSTGWAAVNEPEVVDGVLGRRLDTYLSRLAAWGFSGVVLVADGGQVLLHRGYGEADPGTHRPVTPDTLFDLASVSKQFTAAAVLKLVDAGRVRLDDAVGRHLDSLPGPIAGIRIEQLLRHRSGLPRELGRDFQAMSREEFLDLVANAEVGFEPATDYRYSNVGYALLTVVIEVASGRPFEEYMRDELFAPARMSATRFYGEGDASEPFALAIGGALASQSPREWPHTWNHRAGGIVSTAGDLYRWTQALEHGDVLSAGALAQMREEGPDGYGFGLGIARTSWGQVRLSHTGLWYAFSSQYRHYPGSGTTIIVLSNTAAGGLQYASVPVAAIETTLFGALEAAPPAIVEVPPATLARFAGEYVFESGGRVTLASAEGRVSLRWIGQDAADALAGRDRPTPEMAAQVNRWTVQILEGVGVGDFETLARVAPRGRYERYVRILPPIWQQRIEERGAIGRVEVLGTVAPAGPDASWQTYARIVYEQGDEGVMLTWSPSGTLLGLANEDPPFEESLVTFRPSSHNELAAFHPLTGRNVRVHLRADRSDTQLCFLAAGTESCARRVCGERY